MSRVGFFGSNFAGASANTRTPSLTHSSRTCSSNQALLRKPGIAAAGSAFAVSVRITTACAKNINSSLEALAIAVEVVHGNNSARGVTCLPRTSASPARYCLPSFRPVWSIPAGGGVASVTIFQLAPILRIAVKSRASYRNSNENGRVPQGGSIQFFDPFAFREDRHRSAGLVGEVRVERDAEVTVPRCQEIAGMQRSVTRLVALACRRTDHLTHLHAPAGHQQGHRPSPVLTPRLTSVIVELWGVRHLAHHHQQHIPVKTAVVQVLDEHRDDSIEHRESNLHLFEDVPDAGVVVPRKR